MKCYWNCKFPWQVASQKPCTGKWPPSPAKAVDLWRRQGQPETASASVAERPQTMLAQGYHHPTLSWSWKIEERGKKRMQTTRPPSNQLSILVWTNPAESFLLEAITQDDQVKDPLRTNALRCSAWGHCSSQPLMCSFRALTYNSEHAKTCYVTMWNQESARGDLSQPQRPSTIETENLLRDNSQLETWDDQQTWATHPWILAVQLQCLQLDPMHILNPKHITSVASAAKGWTMIDMLNVRLVVKNKWIMEWQWRMISMVYSL